MFEQFRVNTFACKFSYQLFIKLFLLHSELMITYGCLNLLSFFEKAQFLFENLHSLIK